MDDENVKFQLMSMVAEAHVVPADAMEDEWEQWRTTAEADAALESASLGDLEPAQTQFVEHLERAGLLDSNEHAPIGAPLVSEAGYKSMPHGAGRGKKVHPGSHRWPQPKKHMINTPHPLGGVLGRRGGYVYRAGESADDAYENELFAVSGHADADADPEAVFGVDDRRRDMAERAFLEKLEQNEPALATVGGSAKLSSDSMDYLERLAMEQDPYAEELEAGAPFEEELEPIGGRFGDYAFIKMLGALLRRHRMDTSTMRNHGNRVGAKLAEAISDMDRRGRRTAEFPEGAEQQRVRRNAVVTILVRMLGAVGPKTLDYMQQAAEELYMYLQHDVSAAYFDPSAASAEEHLEPIGAPGSYRRLRSARRRVARYGHGAQKKGRAVGNMRDRAGIANGIVNIAKHMLPPPGSERGPSAMQLDFDAQVGRSVAALREIVGANPGMEQGLVEFVVGAVKRYVIDDAFKYVAGTRGGEMSSPESLSIARAAMRELEKFRRPLPAAPIDSRLPYSGERVPSLPISAGAKRMAVDLMAHAEDYLDRNPTHVGRAERGLFSLLVPENQEVLAKVSERLRNGGRKAKDEYVANALISRHPHDDVAKGHVLALSGMLFHVGDNPHNMDKKGGQSIVLSQMVRVGSADRTPHDDVWDAEARNAGGAVVARSDLHRMLCRVGTPVELAVQKGAKTVSVIPLFYDIPHKEKTRV